MNHPLAPTAMLTDMGVSIWLDDLSRQRLRSGSLQELVDEFNVVGVTTNPTIFATAIAGSDAYDEQLKQLKVEGASAAEAATTLTTTDVRDAADLLAPVFVRTHGRDGRVSIEVEPALAYDADATAHRALELHRMVDRPNLMVKIPATAEGLRAITAATAAGISVNITLIFNLRRYRDVIHAYLLGLERAYEAGLDITMIRSVASLFVSRVDSEVNRRLEELGTSEARRLHGLAGVANARLAYQIYQREFGDTRAMRLLALGANRQRPLWASTSVKDPTLPDTHYVTELIAPMTISTMPEATLRAVADHGVIASNTIRGTYEESGRILADVDTLGISYDDVTTALEQHGVELFTRSWDDLIGLITTKLR
jgi:transaldolase